MSGGTDNGGDDRTLAQFFFEVGYGACWAEAFVRSGGVRPFPITDDGIERAWEVAREGHDDLADFDRKKALSEAAPEMAEELRFVRGLLANSGAESGYCMCGDPTDGHNIGSGHAPVDSHTYVASQAIERIDALLTKIGASQ